jgi:hypothetical protein
MTCRQKSTGLYGWEQDLWLAKTAVAIHGIRNLDYENDRLNQKRMPT